MSLTSTAASDTADGAQPTALAAGQTCIYVTRHGQTDANLQKRVQGQGDNPLNDTGLAQAAALADYFACHPIDHLYCSDLRRARQTAQVLVERLHLPVSYHPELRARRMGDYEGATHAQLKASGPADFERLKHDPAFRPPGNGESVDDLRGRAVPLVRQVAAAGHRRIAILSHHKVCQLILAELAGGQMRAIANARPAVVIHHNGRFFHAPDED